MARICPPRAFQASTRPGSPAATRCSKVDSRVDPDSFRVGDPRGVPVEFRPHRTDDLVCRAGFQHPIPPLTRACVRRGMPVPGGTVGIVPRRQRPATVWQAAFRRACRPPPRPGWRSPGRPRPVELVRSSWPRSRCPSESGSVPPALVTCWANVLQSWSWLVGGMSADPLMRSSSSSLIAATCNSNSVRSASRFLIQVGFHELGYESSIGSGTGSVMSAAFRRGVSGTASQLEGRPAPPASAGTEEARQLACRPAALRISPTSEIARVTGLSNTKGRLGFVTRRDASDSRRRARCPA